MACPMCKRETDRKWRPFCSKRCADLDLGKWVTGSYAIPTEDAPESFDDTAESNGGKGSDRRH